MSPVATNLNGTIILNDGVEMPLFGLGTYQMPFEDAEAATLYALQHGYRMIDTAAIYKNEEAVGSGIRKSGIPRKEIFVVTKLWQADHGYEKTKAALKESLKKLGLDYVDLYLIHSPKGGEILQSYDAMMELKREGLTRSVGVSNFGVQHLAGLKKESRPMPSTNQIELHTMCRREDIVDFCQKNGIAVMGYSPLAKAKKMDDPELTNMASKYNKTVAQLQIRWSVQKGYITIPKSTKPERILENSKVFDWKISDEDMKKLESQPTFIAAWDPTTSNWEELK